MKYIKFISIALITFLVSFVNAQDLAVANVNLPSSENNEVASKTVINKNAIKELSSFVGDKLDMSTSALNYVNSINVTMEISINRKGELIQVNVVEGSEILGGEIKNVLKDLKEVSPVTFNGKASTATIRIPFTVEN